MSYGVVLSALLPVPAQCHHQPRACGSSLVKDAVSSERIPAQELLCKDVPKLQGPQTRLNSSSELVGAKSHLHHCEKW